MAQDLSQFCEPCHGGFKVGVSNLPPAEQSPESNRPKLRHVNATQLLVAVDCDRSTVIF